MNNLNLSIFKDDDSECKGNEQWEDCISTKRLLVALKYYSITRKNNDIFCDFISEVYNVQLLEDYAHFIKEHDDNLYEINQYLTNNESACSVATCAFSSRHHSQKKIKNKVKNEKFGFYAETLDSLHYYFVHLFECGMRINMDEKTEEEDDEKTAYFDADFARMVQRVNKRRQNTQNFNRFQVADKFTLDNDNDSKSNTTFSDEVNEKMQSKNFLSVVEDEDFETDSIKMDILDAKANLFKILSKEKKINLIKEFIASIKRQNNTFSVGYRFFYWPKCQNMDKENFRSDNMNNYGGYKVSELYVNKKYADFKEEILFYKYITMENYKNIMAKANEYIRTENVKKIKAKTDEEDGTTPKCYDISKNALLGLWNLIALILYTDFSAHCSEFSASFRKLSPFEALNVTKERNRNFWWMAKTLRETVEIFGRCRYDASITSYPRPSGEASKTEAVGSLQPKLIYDKSEGLFGPFYTGVNREMVLTQFNIRLNAPTSTTTEISVALRFGGSDGTIITLNNDSLNDTFDFLRGFDVSWLSKYKEESERLFFGGYNMMKVQSVRLTQTKQNFEKLISPLYYLDAMLTGSPNVSLLSIGKNGYKVIERLFEYGVARKKDDKMDEYIYECFDAFVKNKESLHIDLGALDICNELMSELIVHSIQSYSMIQLETRSGLGDDKHQLYKKENDKTNLIRSELVLIFPDVTSVHIDASLGSGYPFSLAAFLSVLKMSNWKKVEIKGFWPYVQLTRSLRKQFYLSGVSIQFSYSTYGGGLTIERIENVPPTFEAYDQDPWCDLKFIED